MIFCIKVKVGKRSLC